MLKIKRKNIVEKWFCNTASFFDVLKFVKYNQASYKISFFIKLTNFHTIHINLLKSEEEIFKNFRKNTRYEINKARREGVQLFLMDIGQKEYCNYYNDFAKKKGLSLISENEINYYWNNLLIFGGGENLDEIQVINSYLVDGERARLFHSISMFRISKKTNKSFSGMANRFSHFETMKYFKSKGYEIYDLGGIGKNKKTETIDKFKLGFSNNIIEEYHYISPVLFLFLKAKKML